MAIMSKPIIIIIVWLAALGVILGLIWPNYNVVADLNGQIKAEEKSLNELGDLISRAEELNERYKSLEKEDEVLKIDLALPDILDNITSPDLIVSLEALGVENGIFLDAMDFRELDSSSQSASDSQALTISEPPALGEAALGEAGSEFLAEERLSAPEFKVLQINLESGGSYENFKNFLSALENNLRIMDIKSVKLSPGEEDDFKIDLVLETYYR